MNENQIRSDIRKVQLNILIKLDKVCHENRLRYYLTLGIKDGYCIEPKPAVAFDNRQVAFLMGLRFGQMGIVER